MKSTQESFKSKAAKVLGILHIICGLIPIGSSFVLIFKRKFTILESGIWSSVFFFISGSLSINSATHTNLCLVITTLFMSFFSVISAGSLIILSTVELVCSKRPYCYHSIRCAASIDTLNVLQIFVGSTEMILAIISSILSCKDTCCRPMTRTIIYSMVKYTQTCDMEHVQIMYLGERERFIRV